MTFLSVLWRGAALWLALALPGLAHAFGASECLASRFGGNVGCNAKDVSITNIAVVGAPPFCVGGGSMTVDLDVTVTFGSSTRYDIGIFLAADGKDPTLLPANGGAASCAVSVLPPTAPFLDLDPGPDRNGLRDTCGDGYKAGVGGGTGQGVLRMTGVTVRCQSDATAGGKLYIPFAVSWDQSSTASNTTAGTCTSNLDPVAGTSSKCSAPVVTQGTVNVYVLPSLSKTNGTSQITPGETTRYTITVHNTTGAALSNLVFKDPAVANLNVSAVSCTAAGGASCPAAPLSVAALQGAGLMIPAMPSASTVVFTVDAQLTGNPSGTLTNTASISVNGQTHTASDSDAIVYPTLTSQKTLSTLNDPVNGSANPKAIPGAEMLYSLRIANAGPGTVNRDVMSITDAVPAHLAFFAGDLGASGSGPVRFIDGTPASGLSYSFSSLASTTDGVAFSADGGASWGYTPVAGYDPAVTHIRIFPRGTMAGWSGAGSPPSFTVEFKARIK